MDQSAAKRTAASLPEEKRLQTLLRILACAFGLAIFGYLLPALGGPLQDFFVNLPFVTNSVVKIGVLALLAFIASADVRRFRVLVIVVILGHVISELATIAVLLWGKTDYTVLIAGSASPIRQILYGSIILDGLVLAFLIWFYRSAQNARLRLDYLSGFEFKALRALAEVVIKGRHEVVSADHVARNVDRYLSGFGGRNKWIMKLVLTGLYWYPLLSLRPPLPLMNPGDRLEFIRRRFYQDVTYRLVPPFWRMIVQGMIRMGKQLSYLGYYNDPASHASVGYIPFSRRPDAPDRLRNSPVPTRHPLRVQDASSVGGDEVYGDVVIIGSGAAAAIMANGLVKSGRSVVMIERGEFVDPTRFSEDEVEMLSKLYADGALQLSQDFRFQVLQGSCVGGTTVINNAVCFDLPEEVLERWNDPASLNAGIDAGKLHNALDEVRSLMSVQPQDHRFLNKGAAKFLEGIDRMKLRDGTNAVNVVEANVAGCVGCGYCNIGCAYGKKLSMLDTVLPAIQREFGAENLRIIAGCEAERIIGRGKEITGVQCRFTDGRPITVRGKTFVVSAGAISSSLLLLKSSIRPQQAGKRLSFNMGSPMTAVFDQVLNSYDGLQISHYLRLEPGRGYVLETWFNPPVAQALTMPGWFEDHFHNMRRYNRLSCTGVLVGTESNGEVRIAGLTGREVNYTPTRADLDKLLAGLVLSGEIFLAAGATSVIPNTWQYREFNAVEALRRLPEFVRDSSDITLGTGHPQGGNVISRDPGVGVVNEEFRVYGYDNLFVCDASVFPSSIGVNPQLTVMTLAQYAVPFVAGSNRVTA